MTAGDATGPKIDPADSFHWPMLKIRYRTEPEKLAALLPPGIEPGRAPNVHLTVYNFPVLNEPEYGVVVAVEADYRGIEGLYTLGYGIDQESAIFISQETNGQPKYPCAIRYFRMGNRVHAKCTHQGYTFLEFRGEVTGPVPNPPNHTEDEWWIKVSRAAGIGAKGYDFPPRVVRVHSSYGTAYMEAVDGTLTLNESPWDPIRERLPLREQISAHLWTPTFLGREITLEGELDPDAFWPHADVIGGSRWPGSNGGPRYDR